MMDSPLNHIVPHIGATILTIAFASLWLVLIAACDQSPQGPPLAVLDSGDVEIVAFDLDRLTPVGVVAAHPNWSFGESQDQQGSVPLSEVRDARLLTDGRIAIINGVDEEIILVDPDNPGTVRRLAGKGEGPGEAQFICSVFEHKKAIGVYDLYRREVMYYSSGQYTGSWKPPPDGIPGPLYPEIIIPDGDGYYLGDLFAPWDERESTVVRRTLLAARVSGTLVDTIAIIPGDTGTPMAFALEELPFGADFAFSKGRDGLWLGDSDVPQLMFFNRQGDLKRLVRWDSREDRRLTRRRIRRTRSRALDGKPRTVQARIKRWWKEAPLPSHVPAWGRVLTGIDGSVWVSAYPGPEVDWPRPLPYPRLKWFELDSNGFPVGTLITPARLKVTGFGPDYLIGIHTDEMNVETVVRFGISEVPGEPELSRAPRVPEGSGGGDEVRKRSAEMGDS